MLLSLLDIKRLATDVARDEDSRLHVVAALSAEGARDYAEVVLTQDGQRPAHHRLVVGVAREASESEARSVLRARLRGQLDAPQRLSPLDDDIR